MHDARLFVTNPFRIFQVPTYIPWDYNIVFIECARWLINYGLIRMDVQRARRAMEKWKSYGSGN